MVASLLRHPLTALAVALLQTAPPATAQPPATSPPARIAVAGDRLFVALDDDGTVLAGSLLELSDTSIGLLMASGRRDIPMRAVVRVERRGDGTLDGAVRGASIIGGLCVLVCGQSARNPSHFAQIVLTNAAVGALFGWWLDRDHVARTVVYRRR